MNLLMYLCVCVCDEFSGEFWGQTFVYLSISCGTTVHPVQNLSPEVLVAATWMIHTDNIIFDICPHQLNWLGLSPIRDSPYDVPPQFLEPAHHTGQSQLRMMTFDIVITRTSQKVGRGTTGAFVAVTICECECECKCEFRLRVRV